MLAPPLVRCLELLILSVLTYGLARILPEASAVSALVGGIYMLYRTNPQEKATSKVEAGPQE